MHRSTTSSRYAAGEYTFLGTHGRRVYEHYGHQFVEVTFKQPTYCAFCQNFMWGFTNQGFRCTECRCAVHKECHGKVLGKCTRAPSESDEVENVELRFGLDVPHRFLKWSYKKPTFCNHCGKFLLGLAHQGVKCQSCGTNYHEECSKKCVKTCGVNQQMMSDAIDTIYRHKLLSVSSEVIATTGPSNRASKDVLAQMRRHF